MSIESVKSAAMTYQGSTSQAAEKQQTDVKTDTTDFHTTSNQLAAETVNITSNEAGLASQNEQKDNSVSDVGKQNEQIKKAVENLNKNNPHTEAIFGTHEGTNRVTIKIVDKDTKKILKEYPPEKTLDMIEKVWEMAGIMVDEKR